MKPAWTIPLLIVAVLTVGFLLIVQNRRPCHGDTKQIDRQTVLWRLQKALQDSWKDVAYKDDRVLLSRRLNMFAMEINQFICDLENDVCGTSENTAKNNRYFALGRNNWKLVPEVLLPSLDR